MLDAAKPESTLAGVTVRLAALWILAGALFKLLLGTPADLPGAIRDLPLELVLTYKLAIAAELCVASVALLRPRWGWPPVAAVFVVFDLVLAAQMAEGAASCGCFGAKVPVPPWAMLTVDSLLLLLVLLSRPWSLGRGGTHPLAVAAALAVAVTLPWLVDREVGVPVGDGGEPTLGGFVVLDLEAMVGRSIYDTELATWIEGDVYGLPGEGLWVTWRWTCDHCAEHLERLAQEPPLDVPFLVLVRLRESHDTDANRAVLILPAGENVLEASCPDSVEYVTTTPGELVVENGIVVRAEEGVGRDDG